MIYDKYKNYVINYYLKFGILLLDSQFKIERDSRLFIIIGEYCYFVSSINHFVERILTTTLDWYFEKPYSNLTIKDVHKQYKKYGIYINKEDILIEYDNDNDNDIDIFYSVNDKLIELTVSSYYLDNKCDNIVDAEYMLSEKDIIL